MIPADQDFELIVKTTFGPYLFVFNKTKTRTIGDFTVTPSTDLINLVAHGLVNTDQVRFTTTDVLPAPLVEGQLYYVVSAATDTFKVSLTSGGAAIDLVDVGTGTHTVLKRGLPLDLTGWTFYAWVKQDLEDPDSPLILDLAPTILSPATNGIVQIVETPAQTDGLLADTYKWSLIGVAPDTSRYAFARGQFVISKISTHP